MTAYRAAVATATAYELAEGVLWDDRAGLVRWVDIGRGAVMSGRLRGDRIEEIESVEIGQTAGAVALAEDGGLLVAAARGLATLSVEGVLSVGPDLLGARAGVRFNDGAVDPWGRFVVGTLSLSGGTGGEEVLLRVSPDGNVETIRTGVGLSNGVAFSPDGTAIYHVDTMARTVARHSYGPHGFDDNEGWEVVVADPIALPDGLTVDSEGTLWLANWGGSSVSRYAPTGQLIDVVSVGAAQVACPAFIGPNLDTLAISTAHEGLDHPTGLDGAIFAADVRATGLPAHRWAGSTTTPFWHLPMREEKTA